MLEIPFYFNRSHSCAETSTKSLLKYYFPERGYNLKDIRKIINKKAGKLVYLVQIADALEGLELEINYYSDYNLRDFLEMDLKTKKEEFYRFLGKNAERVIKHTDFSVLEECLRRVCQSESYKEQGLEFSYVEKAFSEGSSVLCLLNFDLFVERENNYNGHYVLITNISNDAVWFHDVGPKNAEPNKRVSKEIFIDCWNKTCFFDEDTIFIKEK